MEQSVAAMIAIPARMVAAWNRGDAADFFADFADDAQLVDFEGTVLQGREAMVAFQQPVFESVLKGSRLAQSEVPFARVVQPGWGVVHHRVGMMMAGEPAPPRSRFLMQLLAVVWQDGRWQVAALQNARLISIEAAMALETMAVE